MTTLINGSSMDLRPLSVSTTCIIWPSRLTLKTQCKGGHSRQPIYFLLSEEKTVGYCFKNDTLTQKITFYVLNHDVLTELSTLFEGKYT